MTTAANIKTTRRGSPLRVTLPDELPPLDKEQDDAAFDMAQGDKLLLSDPGAGKTITALEALAMVRQHRPAEAERVLIVCPPVAVYTWLRWVAKVYEDAGWPCHIDFLDKGNSPVTEGATHIVTTYSLLSRKNDLASTLIAWKPQIIIADEFQALAGWSSNTTRAFYGNDFSGGIARTAKRRWLLSGTPIPRYNDGLYPTLKAVFPDRLSKYKAYSKQQFLDLFCYVERVRFGAMRQAKDTVTGSRNNKLLHDLLYSAPAIAVRNKLVLGKPIFSDITLDFVLSRELASLELELEQRIDDQEDGRIVDARLARALHMLAKESARHIVADLIARKKAKTTRFGSVVLYWHTAVGDAIRRGLEEAGYRVGVISGATNKEADNATEADFNSGKLDYVVGQIAAMGVAINLQEHSDEVFFAEESFSATANLQAYQRVWRRGQKQTVRIYRYVALASSLRDVKLRTTTKKSRGTAAVLDAQ